MDRPGDFADGLVTEGQQLGIKEDRINLPDPVPGHRDAAFLRETLTRGLGFGQHPGERLSIEMALVERDPAFLHDTRHDARLGRAGSDRADPAVQSFPQR